jgi:hypothetical protein
MAKSGGEIGRSPFKKLYRFQKAQECFSSGPGPSMPLREYPYTGEFPAPPQCCTGAIGTLRKRGMKAERIVKAGISTINGKERSMFIKWKKKRNDLKAKKGQANAIF